MTLRISTDACVNDSAVFAADPHQDLKFHIKFSRQNGIHVSPTTTLNGLVFDSSSSWGLEEWQDVLDPYL